MNKKLLENITILYVEDQEEIKNFTCEILKSFVKEVIPASNGEEGLELYKINKDKIDIVISDINMPKLNGLEMYEQMLKIKKNIPVIITSAHTDTNFYQKALNLGISSYTLKPIDLYDMVNNIIKLLETKQLSKTIINNNISLNTQEFINLINEQISAIAIYENDKIIFTNNKFKETFGDSINPNEFINETEYFSLSKVQSEISWKDEILNLKELDKVIKISIQGTEKSFRIDLFKVENRSVISLYDITNLQNKSSLFEYKINHDLLTGLYNKTKFEKIFNIEAKRAERYRKDLTLILIDFMGIEKIELKSFKYIMPTIAKSIKDNIREHDIEFRWENSSFLILLPETDIDGALNTSYKLEESLNELAEDNHLDLKAYFGVTEFKSQDQIEMITNRLKNALEKSKKGGERINYL